MKGIPSKEANPKGLHQRYKVTKLNGDPVDATVEYFVLRLDDGGEDKQHIKACRVAIIAYAKAIASHLPDLAADLLLKYSE